MVENKVLKIFFEKFDILDAVDDNTPLGCCSHTRRHTCMGAGWVSRLMKGTCKVHSLFVPNQATCEVHVKYKHEQRPF